MTDIEKMSEGQLYDLIISAQTALLDKRTALKNEYEDKGDLGIEYLAVLNEVNSLKKGLGALKLFSKGQSKFKED